MAQDESKELSVVNKEMTIKNEGLSPLVIAAMNSDMDVEKLDKLITVQERFDQNQAKKEFYKAFSRFKQNPLIITKDSTVDFTSSKGRTLYKHASLGNIMSIVGPLLSKEGLALSWIPVQNENKISVTAVLSHILGFTIDATLSSPPDTTGNKSSLQAIGSTITFLQRYTGVALLGLAMSNDDDGQGAQEQQEQKKPDYKSEPEATADIMGAKSSESLERICKNYQSDFKNGLTGWTGEQWNRICGQMKSAKEKVESKVVHEGQQRNPGF